MPVQILDEIHGNLPISLYVQLIVPTFTKDGWCGHQIRQETTKRSVADHENLCELREIGLKRLTERLVRHAVLVVPRRHGNYGIVLNAFYQ